MKLNAVLGHASQNQSVAENIIHAQCTAIL